jgi:hypothetical protein
LGIGSNHSELLLPRVGFFPELFIALVELALVLVDPLGRHMMRRMGRPRCEIDEERLVAHQGLLLPNVTDRLVGNVLREVVALLGGLLRLDRRRAGEDRGIVLVGLAAKEPVEVLEAAAGRPVIERPHQAGFPDRNFVAFSELGRGITVVQERLGQRGTGVGPHRVLAWRRGCDFGNCTLIDRVVIAPGQ